MWTCLFLKLQTVRYGWLATNWLELFKKQRVRYVWHDIEEYEPIISVKYEKWGTDDMASKNMTLLFHQNIKSKLRIAYHQRI